MEHGQAESLGLHWGWDGDEGRHWTVYNLDGKGLTALIKWCSEEPQVVTEELQGL